MASTLPETGGIDSNPADFYVALTTVWFRGARSSSIVWQQTFVSCELFEADRKSVSDTMYLIFLSVCAQYSPRTACRKSSLPSIPIHWISKYYLVKDDKETVAAVWAIAQYLQEQLVMQKPWVYDVSKSAPIAMKTMMEKFVGGKPP